MPEKPLTIATYAAGASLAAITLVYVFGPTFFLDDDAANNKKQGVVGLSNAANDCFINSVLQALAGLPDLRKYLIRETHRRKLDGPEVYLVDPQNLRLGNKSVGPRELEGLQKGLLTYGLKDILDRLNERPLYRKTISPQPFIRVLERAFATRISRTQQDAQEFLQIITERLCDEYHAGIKARQQAKNHGVLPSVRNITVESGEDVEELAGDPIDSAGREIKAENRENDVIPSDEEGFPFEGKIESQIECQTCHFKPKPSVSTFVTLTLNVPQVSSTSLNACFDGMLKVEYIEDFKCEWCRLEHALRSKNHELALATDQEAKDRLESDISKIRHAMEEDPENPPEDVVLPALSQSPKRRIARHMYISQFPKVLAVHLSRSVFGFGNVSTKNLAKVAFPESLPLGGLLHRKNYRLLGLISHKGSHNSGHYESFRRQVQPLPFSTPVSFGAGGVYSRNASPAPSAVQSAAQTPRLSTTNVDTITDRGSPLSSTLALDSPYMQTFSSQSSLPSSPRGPAPTSAPRQSESESLRPPSSSQGTETTRPRSVRSLKDKAAETAASIAEKGSLKRRSKKPSSRWWRISDDKIKESKTSEVLGLGKEVYLLFYELDRA